MKPDQDTGAALRAVYEKAGGTRAVFSGKAADYTASRPAYPPALFEVLAGRVAPGEDVTVVDAGAGTGLFTRGLLARGYRVVAVEPNAAMRAKADRSLGENGRYRSVAGSGEAMTLANATADLITVAQAFHWFDAIRARTEFLRVLKPQGLAALVWNDRVEDDPLQAALTGIFREFGGAKHEALVAHEEHSDVRTFFGATRPWQGAWSHAQRLDGDGLLSLAFSRSYMPDRSTHAGRGAGERVRGVFKTFSQDGAVELRYRTVLFLGRPG